jgi:lipocalin
MKYDFEVLNYGTIYLVAADNDEAARHLKEHVNRDAQWFDARTLVVEHRYISGLAQQLKRDGFKVEGL